MLMLVTVVLYNLNSHVAPCFDYLALTNTLVLLVMPSISHDEYTGTSDITWPKKSCCTILIVLPWQMQQCYWWCHLNHMMTKVVPMVSNKKSCFTSFWLSWLNECSEAIDDANGVSGDTDASTDVITWPKSHVAPHFKCPDLHNAMVLSVNNTIGIMWCWFEYWMCQKDLQSHLDINSNILT